MQLLFLFSVYLCYLRSDCCLIQQMPCEFRYISGTSGCNFGYASYRLMFFSLFLIKKYLLRNQNHLFNNLRFHERRHQRFGSPLLIYLFENLSFNDLETRFQLLSSTVAEELRSPVLLKNYTNMSLTTRDSA